MNKKHLKNKPYLYLRICTQFFKTFLSDLFKTFYQMHCIIKNIFMFDRLENSSSFLSFNYINFQLVN